MALKYNMTNEEFDSFAERSHEVLGQIGGPKWHYVDSLRFAFETLTTIGKEISLYSMHDACWSVWICEMCSKTKPRYPKERGNENFAFLKREDCCLET